MISTAEKSNDVYICKRIGVPELEHLMGFPHFFEMETVHACNAKCRMCTIADWPDRPPFMAESIFKKIVSEMADHTDSIRTITLCRDGEPLLDRQMENKIEALKKIGVKNVVFSTNASFLDKKRAESLIASGLDEIMFSVDGHTKEIFENIRRGLDYDRVRRNILTFLETRERLNSNIKARIRMIVQDLNHHQYDQWRDYWSSKVRKTDKVYGRPIHSWGNQIDISRFRHSATAVKAPLCVALWSTMIIHSDGTVPACSVDFKNRYLSGSVATAKIADLWHSTVLANLRKKHLAGSGNDIEICNGCYLWDPETLYQ